jgi:hypothetical protein
VRRECNRERNKEKKEETRKNIEREGEMKKERNQGTKGRNTSQLKDFFLALLRPSTAGGSSRTQGKGNECGAVTGERK